jgi:MtN3 and saliva related transmembrane protein
MAGSGPVNTGTVDLLGMAAGVLTTAAYLPQVAKTWRSRSARDISFGTFALLGVGLCLWLLYGLAIDSLPVVVANAVTLPLVLAILYFKIRYR